MENELTIGTKSMVSLVSENPLGDLIKPLSHEILQFNNKIRAKLSDGPAVLFQAVTRFLLIYVLGYILIKFLSTTYAQYVIYPSIHRLKRCRNRGIYHCFFVERYVIIFLSIGGRYFYAEGNQSETETVLSGQDFA